MKKVVLVYIIVCLLAPFLIDAQVPTDDFAPPVDPPIRLSGTFGELRTNHFHTGLDIKSKKGVVGDPIYAVQDGQVSRFKIQAAGYGQAVYIDHPNGLTSVYGHVESLLPEWEEWIRQQQYQQQSFEVDLKLDSATFTVEKGQKIGTMGTRGYSFGPHLHFELRNTETEAAVNPLLYAFAVHDKIPPQIRNVHIYTLDQKYNTKDIKIIQPQKGSDYRIAGDTLVVAAWRIGLGLEVLDKMNGVYNRNGIYAIKMDVDSQNIYSFSLDSLDFQKLLYVNAHQDFAQRKKKKRRVHRCYRLPGNELDIYEQGQTDGLIELYQDKSRRIDIAVTDHSGNDSNLRFWVKRDPDMPGYESDEFHYLLPHDQPNIIRRNGLELIAQAGSFYKELSLNYEYLEDASDGIFSGVHILENETDPVHRPMRIRIRSFPMDSSLRSKAYVALCGAESTVSLGGQWDGDILESTTRRFGTYCIKVDTSAPVITPLRVTDKVKKGGVFRFRIKDELPTSAKAGGLLYKASVDLQWMLAEFDYKNDLIYCRFLDEWEPGKHTFVLTVKDQAGNERIFRKDFEWVD